MWPDQQSGQFIWTEDALMTEWQLQDAKNRFCAVVDAAVAGDPQWVTRRGKPAVVVLAVEEYESPPAGGFRQFTTRGPSVCRLRYR